VPFLDLFLTHSRTKALTHCRSGAVLLEAIVAIVILSVAGTAAVAMVGQAADGVRRAGAADVEAREASALMHAVALWTREDLDLRLGSRQQGPWRLSVQRPDPELYDVALTDSAGASVILRTSLFRPDTARALLP
jgi:type II secretory pathway pseudopilin PulG